MCETVGCRFRLISKHMIRPFCAQQITDASQMISLLLYADYSYSSTFVWPYLLCASTCLTSKVYNFTIYSDRDCEWRRLIINGLQRIRYGVGPSGQRGSFPPFADALKAANTPKQLAWSECMYPMLIQYIHTPTLIWYDKSETQSSKCYLLPIV